MTKETLTNDKQENLSPNEYVYGNMLHGVDYSKHFCPQYSDDYYSIIIEDVSVI